MAAVMGGDDEGGQHPFTFNLAFGPAVQTLRASSKVTSGCMWMATETRTVDGRRHTDTSAPHARRSTVGSAAVQGLRIVVRLVWLGRYFDTEIRLSSAACEMR